PEQTRIATFLTAVDKRINLLQKKKAELEQYKKSIMQKLFSQTIRFKPVLSEVEGDDTSTTLSTGKGNDFPDWEEKKLGEVYSFKSTNSFSRERLNYEKGAVKNIHYGDIHTIFRTLFDIKEEYVPFINSDVDISRIHSDNFVQKGDLIFADASEDYADIGKTIEIINTNDEQLLSGLHTLLARRINNNGVFGFWSYLMKSYSFRREIMKIAQGSKVLSISATRTSQIQVLLPSPDEQQKIAKFLSSIDKSIEKLGKQIDNSVVFKKGLLQKMFV
ncbi:MAG: restriction endonuclease subunit S, partial [Bacteroidales bacterium]|nr:restriction endonuclease subunit S [Bacteroidales bacterium]